MMTTLLWVMAIVAAIVLWRVFRSGSRRAARSLRMLAARTGGQLHPGGWGNPHILLISHGPRQVQVSLRCISVASDGYQAEFRAAWPDGHEEIELAEPTRLTIRGALPAAPGGSDELREAATRLESVATIEDAQAGAKQGQFFAGAILATADIATVEEWFHATLRLYDLLAAETEPGIAFLGHAYAAAEAGACCQVCGIPVAEGEATRCNKCGAPHHTDCWNYNGGCAIYGCKK